MAKAVYLDTSSLVRRAELTGTSPSPRSLHAGQPVEVALDNPTGPLAISEVGLLEFHDVITSMWRDTNSPNTPFDETWCELVLGRAMADIETGRLRILPLPVRVFAQAMTLVTMCTRQHVRKFRVWDAVHLITSVGWSLELGEQVELWTTDGDFQGFVSLYPYFPTHVLVRNLDD